MSSGSVRHGVALHTATACVNTVFLEVLIPSYTDVLLASASSAMHAMALLQP
jgi:hypothetical protein